MMEFLLLLLILLLLLLLLLLLMVTTSPWRSYVFLFLVVRCFIEAAPENS